MSARENRSPPTIRQVFARGHLQLVLLAVALAAAGLMVSGAFLLRGYEFVNLQLASRSIAYAAEPAVFFGDRKGVEQAVGFVADIGTVDGVVIADASGGQLASWKREDAAQVPLIGGLVNRLFWPKAYTVPIMHDGEAIGSVTIRGNSQGLVRYALSGLVIALCCFGITLLATRLLARRLREGVVVPLERVAAVADAVRIDRDFSRRVSPAGISELDSFGTAFNGLLEEVEGWHANLTGENEALAFRAEHDALTGLGNRTKFQRLLKENVRKAEVLGASFAIIYIDLDRFKAINDNHGHAAGDAVLRDFAHRLQASVRGRDQIFRLGGDEFAILLDPAQERLQTHQVVARIHAAMLPPAMIGEDRRIAISCSIGAANYPEDATSVDELLTRADRKMYQEKRGRSRDD